MSSSTASQVSTTHTPGAPAPTLAQRLLRSLNSLGVIVADSAQPDRAN